MTIYPILTIVVLKKKLINLINSTDLFFIDKC